MINLAEVLRNVPHFDHFCSVQQLCDLVDRLRTDSRFTIEVAGTSQNGVPIHHIRFGNGSRKALFLGGVHAMEPIGSLTVFGLITLLREGSRTLLESDVEWHIVPCADPDGAILNEGWSQKPFTLENYIHHYYVQPRPDQIEFSFPIAYRRLRFDKPSREAAVLQGILDRIRPDFCFSLHNSSIMGGTWFHLTRDLGPHCYTQLHELLRQHRVTLQGKARFEQYAEGIRRPATVQSYYEFLESQQAPIPQEYLQGKIGASSLEYILQINPTAVVFIAELTYGQHPGDISDRETGQDLRQLNLRAYADNLFIAATILEEWEKVKPDLDVASPFYRKIINELVVNKDKLHEGITAWYQPPAQQLLFNPAYSRVAREYDCVQACGLYKSHFLGNAYAFVRLLKASRQSSAVKQAIQRVDRIFDGAIEEMKQQLDFAAYEVVSCDRLAKVQLGSGLIALNSVLESNGEFTYHQE